MERNVAQPSAREGNVAQRMSLLALVCVCVHEFGYKGMYVCMYVCKYVCMYACMYAFVQMRKCTGIHMCGYILCTYIYMYTN